MSENSKLYNLHCKTIENMPPICLRFYCPPFLLPVLHVLLSFFERGGGVPMPVYGYLNLSFEFDKFEFPGGSNSPSRSEHDV